MTKEEIQVKKTEVTNRFDELNAQQAEIGDELKRLQGEYRLLENMDATVVENKEKK